MQRIAAFVAFGLGQTSRAPIFAAILPMKVVIAAMLGEAGAFAGIVVLSRAVAQRLDLRFYALAFPIFSTSWEQLITLRIGDGGELGFAQVAVLPLIQLASLTGVVGVSFVVTFIAALLVTVLVLRERGLPWRGVATGGVAAIAAVFAFGIARVANGAGGEPVRVGVAVSDELIARFNTERADEAVEVVDAYVRRTRDLAARGAEVVVLPEKFVGVTPAYADAVDHLLATAAATAHVWLVAGLNRVGMPTPRNVAAVFAPDGNKVTEYDKIHLVAGYEDAYVPGQAVGRLAQAPGPWGVAICRDLIVAELGRRLSRAGARLVLDPAWDFGTDGPLESRVARVRAVENGFALVRAAKKGVITISDGYGRAQLAVPTSSTAEVLAVVPVTLGPGITFYARAGDWFGNTCVTGAVLLVVALLVRW